MHGQTAGRRADSAAPRCWQPRRSTRHVAILTGAHDAVGLGAGELGRIDACGGGVVAAQPLVVGALDGEEVGSRPGIGTGGVFVVRPMLPRSASRGRVGVVDVVARPAGPRALSPGRRSALGSRCARWHWDGVDWWQERTAHGGCLSGRGPTWHWPGGWPGLAVGSRRAAQRHTRLKCRWSMWRRIHHAVARLTGDAHAEVAGMEGSAVGYVAAPGEPARAGRGSAGRTRRSRVHRRWLRPAPPRRAGHGPPGSSCCPAQRRRSAHCGSRCRSQDRRWRQRVGRAASPAARSPGHRPPWPRSLSPPR